MKYELEIEESDWNEFATVVRVEDDGTRVEVGWFGGEPEDQTYYRNYAWVVPALNDAYNLGLKVGYSDR